GSPRSRNVFAQPALRCLGEYDGREANCSPVWIDVRWTIRGQSDPEHDNYLSGMIPSAWDADASLRLMQSGARGMVAAFPRPIPPRKRRSVTRVRVKSGLRAYLPNHRYRY